MALRITHAGRKRIFRATGINTISGHGLTEEVLKEKLADDNFITELLVAAVGQEEADKVEEEMDSMDIFRAIFNIKVGGEAGEATEPKSGG